MNILVNTSVNIAKVVACRGICDQFKMINVDVRYWTYKAELMRCSLCDIIIHQDNWVKRDSGRITCPCCGMQLKRNSTGKRAREKRQQDFVTKVTITK